MFGAIARLQAVVAQLIESHEREREAMREAFAVERAIWADRERELLNRVQAPDKSAIVWKPPQRDEPFAQPVTDMGPWTAPTPEEIEKAENTDPHG